MTIIKGLLELGGTPYEDLFSTARGYKAGSAAELLANLHFDPPRLGLKVSAGSIADLLLTLAANAESISAAAALTPAASAVLDYIKNDNAQRHLEGPIASTVRAQVMVGSGGGGSISMASREYTLAALENSAAMPQR